MYYEIFSETSNNGQMQVKIRVLKFSNNDSIFKENIPIKTNSNLKNILSLEFFLNVAICLGNLDLNLTKIGLRLILLASVKNFNIPIRLQFKICMYRS